MGAPFSVVEAMSRGIFSDRLLIIAHEKLRHERRFLGWDRLQAPDLRVEHLDVREGDRLIVKTRRNRYVAGDAIFFSDFRVIEVLSS